MTVIIQVKIKDGDSPAIFTQLTIDDSSFLLDPEDMAWFKIGQMLGQDVCDQKKRQYPAGVVMVLGSHTTTTWNKVHEDALYASGWRRQE